MIAAAGRTAAPPDRAPTPSHPAPAPPDPAPVPGRAGGLLLAPVPISPAKPLTLSHLKGLIWADVMLRATRLLRPVEHHHSHTAAVVTAQTLGFWEHLDRSPLADWSAATEEEIGERYVQWQAAADRPPYRALAPYRAEFERTGWVHPASRRLLELWAGHYRRLGLHDPGIAAPAPPGPPLDEVLGTLAARDLCLDLRAEGGPVYLDGTRWGLPLRRVVAADGQPNYLAGVLQDLLPVAGAYDEVVLLCDRDLSDDYTLLSRVLSALGVRCSRLTLSRVPIDGVVRSARHGGWHGNTAGELLDRCLAGFDPATVRLGLRLYFIAVLGPDDHQSFSPERVHRCLRRAERMLAGSDGPGRAGTGAPAELVRAMAAGSGRGYADPYRMTASLLDRRPRVAVRDAIEAAYVG